MFIQESSLLNHGFNSSTDLVNEIHRVFNKRISSGYDSHVLTILKEITESKATLYLTVFSSLLLAESFD